MLSRAIARLSLRGAKSRPRLSAALARVSRAIVRGIGLRRVLARTRARSRRRPRRDATFLARVVVRSIFLAPLADALSLPRAVSILLSPQRSQGRAESLVPLTVKQLKESIDASNVVRRVAIPRSRTRVSSPPPRDPTVVVRAGARLRFSKNHRLRSSPVRPREGLTRRPSLRPPRPAIASLSNRTTRSR